MSRKVVYIKYRIPSNIVDIVKSICADYKRRDRAIKGCMLAAEVAEEYKRLNEAIDEALGDVEAEVQPILLDDFQMRRGYDTSPAALMLSKNAYYRRKKKFIHDTAKLLFLL